jgi:hypothetical protein
MNFKQATDALLKSVTLEDLARELRVSVQTVRQARAAGESKAHRPPPSGWEAAVLSLLRARIDGYQKLTKRLES